MMMRSNEGQAIG
ncbi:unnamed protein product [Lathyrus sativus]|nr:unnamed protein product [Lathyrus sativus]